jgi:hypothetical protein
VMARTRLRAPQEGQPMIATTSILGAHPGGPNASDGIRRNH